MQRCSSLSVALSRVLAPCALLALGAGAAEATPAVIGAAGVYVGAPGHGARWVGGPYRPWVRPGWGAWAPGRPGWGWGPGSRWGTNWGWGPGWGWGVGWGAGWGAGWAVAPAWSWAAPPAVWVAPSWVPMDAAVNPQSFEEQPAVERAPAAPQAAAQQPGYWYYCTEPAGYYPYVNTCSRPWIAVNPTAR
jgi:hypothetical protein